MKKGLKIATITLGSIILLMLILPFAFRGKITEIVKREGNKMLNAQFDFKRLDISLFKHFPQASVTLEDLWLKGTGDFANDTLVQAGEVTAAINIFSLFGSSGYDIGGIYIDNTRLHAIILPDGRVNWDIMKPSNSNMQDKEKSEEVSSSTFRIKLQQLAIKDMNLIYDDRQTNNYANIKEFDAFCTGDLGSDHTTLKLEAETEALTYKTNGIPFLSNANISVKMDVDADFTNNKFTLKENTLRINAIQTSLDGWITIDNPAINMDLKLKTNDIGFKEILSLIPAIYTTDFSSLKTDGTATLTASAKGTLLGDTIPSFNVDLKVKDAMFRYPSLPAGVDQINISANIQNPGGNIDKTIVNIQPFNFRLAENQFSLIAHIETPVSDPAFNIEAKGKLNLGMIKQVCPINEMTLNGIIDANMLVSGNLSYIEKEQYDKVKATGTIRLTDMKLKMKNIPDIEIKNSLFTFAPQYLQLNETTVNIGRNDFTANCRFENYIGYLLKGSVLKGNLNIQSEYLNLNDFMSEQTDSVVATSGQQLTVQDTITSTGIIEVPQNIDLQMDANMKQVLLDKMAFNNVLGQIVIKNKSANMKNLSINTMGGNIVINGVYSTINSQRPKVEAGLKLTDISFAQAYKELDMVQKLAPIFENLKGNFSGNIQIATSLDEKMNPLLNTTQGEGTLLVKDLGLSGVKAIDQIADAIKQPSLKNLEVKNTQVDFAIKDGRVTTKPFDIKMGDYSLNLAGSTGLDQTIDYNGKLSVPISGRKLDVGLKIGGSFNSPKVSVDMNSLTNKAIESIATEALGKWLGKDSNKKNNSNNDSNKQTEDVEDKLLDLLKNIK